MVVCFLDGLYLDATLPLLTRLLGQSHACYYISFAYYFYYACTTLMRGGNWCYLDYGESAACVTWVRGG